MIGSILIYAGFIYGVLPFIYGDTHTHPIHTHLYTHTPDTHTHTRSAIMIVATNYGIA